MKKKKFESQVRVRVWDFWLLNSDQGGIQGPPTRGRGWH